MNDVQIFSNPEFGQVRTVDIDGDPWFVGKDVAAALGYENTKDALKNHVDSEDKIMGSQNATPPITDSLGRIQYPTWINESGLYALIFGSRLPSAKKFKHWVTSEVLPAIRKTGHYEMTGRSAYDTKATSVGEIVNLVRMQQKAMDRRGCSPEDVSEMMDATFRQFGIQTPGIFLAAPGMREIRVKEGLDTDENLAEYARELRNLIAEGTWGLVLEDDFEDFCRKHGLDADKYKEWLYDNKYIACSNEHGERKYTMSQYIGSGEGHGIMMLNRL